MKKSRVSLGKKSTFQKSQPDDPYQTNSGVILSEKKVITDEDLFKAIESALERKITGLTLFKNQSSWMCSSRWGESSGWSVYHSKSALGALWAALETPYPLMSEKKPRLRLTRNQGDKE